MQNKPPSRMSKKELYNALLEMGYQKKDLVGKKRPELKEIYISEPIGRQAEAALDDAEETTENLVVEQNGYDSMPSPDSPEWTQFVLGQFQDDELDGENPRVEGLRRVAENLVGTIVEEGCDLVSVPTIENGMRACAKAWAVFMTAGMTKRFEALADASPENVTGDFRIYLCAMADTRAKGRCFRNALKLRRVIAAEEVRGNKDFVEDNPENATAIQTGQITGIRMIADRLNVSIAKTLSLLEINHEVLPNGGVDLKRLTKDEAIIVLKKLNDFQVADEIPEQVRRN